MRDNAPNTDIDGGIKAYRMAPVYLTLDPITRS
jgi:hypothetical protein